MKPHHRIIILISNFRYTDGSTEEFCKMYRKTLARDGGKEKEKVEQNIKTFLRQRKRHHRDMNDI